MNLHINSLDSNFSYELVKKSNSKSYYEYNINLNFDNSFSNSPTLIITFNSKLFST